MKNSELLQELKMQKKNAELLKHSFFMKRNKRRTDTEKENHDDKNSIGSSHNKFIIKRKIKNRQYHFDQAQEMCLMPKKKAAGSNGPSSIGSVLAISQRSKFIEKRKLGRLKNLKLNSWDHNRIFPKVKGKRIKTSRQNESQKELQKHLRKEPHPQVEQPRLQFLRGRHRKKVHFEWKGTQERPIQVHHANFEPGEAESLVLSRLYCKNFRFFKFVTWTRTGAPAKS